MSVPLDSFAADLYGSLEPLAGEDEANAWALATLCAAIGTMFQPAEDLARDTEEGPGWSAVVDLQRCPDDWLPWLAQFVGVTVPLALSPAEQREVIASTAGFYRGTRAAMTGAIAATLTSTKTVEFRERQGSPYRLDVVTYIAETPDPALTARAALSQKPAGIVLTYAALPGATYTKIKAHFATYTALRSGYATYQAMRDTQLS